MISPSNSTPATRSAEAMSMAADLTLIEDCRAGLRAVRAKASIYLPQYESETRAEWNRRIAASAWRPEFTDALHSLASKPFVRPVGLGPNPPESIVKFAEDVDGRGNNLATFARRLFTDALADGLALVLVDCPPAPGRQTIAEYHAAGWRPYWASYCASSILGLRTSAVGGSRVVSYVRLLESVVEDDGPWSEKEIQQVRVLRPGEYEIWRDVGDGDWQMHDSGPMFATEAGGVPCVLYRTGEAIGDLQTRSPLLSLAEMQIELYRALSRQVEIHEYAGSPMLCVDGADVPAEGSRIQTGPKRALIGNWRFVSPDADLLKEIREHATQLQSDMQRLALAPMLNQPRISATAASLAASKASSQLAAWAEGLRDALQTLLGFTIGAMLLDDRRSAAGWKPVVDLVTNFDSEVSRIENTRLAIEAARAGVLRPDAAAHELQRRGALDPGADPDEMAEDVEAA